MTRVLLVTNDFPPRRGGIQSYLESLVGELVNTGEHPLTVYAPKWKGAGDYDDEAGRRRTIEVVRHPTTLMMPEPSVASRMRRLIAEPRRRHGVVRRRRTPGAAVAAGARRRGDAGGGQHPRPRGGLVDAAVGANGAAPHRKRHRRRDLHQPATPAAGSPPRSGPPPPWNGLSPGVDTDRFEPDSVARAELRARYGLGERPVVVCVSRLVPRKGQDMLIRALPAIRQRVPGAALVIVGGGPYGDDLAQLARAVRRRRATWCSPAVVPGDELPAHHAMADVFAMPCRTRGAGLDVEGLGIVYLEASATGVPVVAGNSGGAPETVHRRRDRAGGRRVGRRRDRHRRRGPAGRPRPRRRDGQGRPGLGRRQLAVARQGGAPLGTTAG